MTLSSTKMLSRESLVACFRPAVVGRPRWLAQYLGQGLCRIKWLSAAGILVWITQAMAVIGGVPELYQRAADRFNVSLMALIVGAVSIGIAGALIVLVGGRGGVSIERARAFIALAATTTVTAEALLFGLSGLAAARAASFDLSLLLVFSIMPLGWISAVAVVAVAAAIAVGSAYVIDPALGLGQAGFIIHPLSFAALGIVANRWYVGAFKGEQLGRMRLDRHMRQVERQKAMIEAQKDEALQQRAEIAKQRAVLFQALSSALTAPVAHAYVDKGGFATELKTVCVIACDAVGFSDTCRKLQPERVVLSS